MKTYNGFNSQSICSQVAPGAIVLTQTGVEIQPGGILVGAGFSAHCATSCPTGSGSASVSLYPVYFGIEPDPVVPDRSGLCLALPKIRLSGASDRRACGVSAYSGAQTTIGDPINTFGGGSDLDVVDLSLATSAGDLVFERAHSSSATATYTSLLGYGWTHNHDIRLIFPADPLGEPGNVWFKAHSASQYRFDINADGSYTPYPGVIATLTKNSGPPVTYTLVETGQATYTFDESGKLTTWSDAQGHGWNYMYDGSGRLDRVTDASGLRYLDLDYDPQARIERVLDSAARDILFAYDGAGDLTSVTDANEQVWSYVYDGQHRLRIARYPGGQQIFRNEYDAQGRAYQQYNGSDVLAYQIIYNADGTRTITDALGNQTTQAYDNQRALVGTTNNSGNTASRTYDPNFRPEDLTDENGRLTELTWSTSGANLTQVIDAQLNQVDLAYDTLNNLTQVTDAHLNVTIYDYNEVDPDPARRTLLLSVDGPLPGSVDLTTYTYTTAADAPQPPGLLKEITDPLGHVTRFTYDSFGQRITMTDALNHTTTYTYDDLGRLETSRDPLARTAWTCYDAAGRVVRTVANASGDGGTPQTDRATLPPMCRARTRPWTESRRRSTTKRGTSLGAPGLTA